MSKPTISRYQDVWRVCFNGMCREHRQQWQALIFYHQMLNQPTNPESLERDQQTTNLDG
jgi:hypothetical protein